MTITDKEKEEFIKDDFKDALKGLFVGAVTWASYPEGKDSRYERGLGQLATFVQARSLYAFFYNPNGSTTIGGTATAYHFEPSWTPTDVKELYNKYMSKNAPIQKRIFHLVYGRANYAGGSASDESDHLKNQVLQFAADIRRLAEDFGRCLRSPFQEQVEQALNSALEAARSLASDYNVKVPEIE